MLSTTVRSSSSAPEVRLHSFSGKDVNTTECLEVPAIVSPRFLDHPPDDEFPERGFNLIGNMSQERHEAGLIDPIDHSFRVREETVGVLSPHPNITEPTLLYD